MIARVFKSGNSQAVRLPKEFRLNVDEVEITRVGDQLVLSPKKLNMDHLVELLRELPDDVFEDIQDRRPPEERDPF